jgi:tetratricopeptide (TPR) repeat protein
VRILFAWGTILLAALAAAPSPAHDEYLWRHQQVRLTEAQSERVAELVRRARLPDSGVAPTSLARAVAQLGDCALAERLIQGLPLPGPAVLDALYPATGGPDLACAGRAAAMIGDAARGPGADGIDARTLYLSGILWRRLGNEEQARAAIGEAERLYDAEEAEQGESLWMCHGGDCMTARWETRLHGLRLLHGTPQWRSELERLASLAEPGLPAGPDLPGREHIGQRVYEELVSAAAAHGEEARGLILAAGTTYRERGRAYYAARVRALLAEGRTAEAIALLPRAGRAFRGADPRLVAEHFEAFAAVEGFYERFRYYFFDRISMETVRALMERGDFDHARSLVAVARVGIDQAGYRPVGFAEMEGLAAFLDDPCDPIGRLTRLARRDGPRSRETEFAELGLFLSSRGDWRGFEEALAAVSDGRVRARMLAELPCRASLRGEAAALRGIRRAGVLRPARGYRGDDDGGFGNAVYPSFLCLLRRGYGDAAVAYAAAIEPGPRKIEVAAGLPIWSPLADPARVRRRLADLALAEIERRGLWAENSVDSVAIDYERLGDYAAADRILERIPDPQNRAWLLIKLIESYVPDPER